METFWLPLLGMASLFILTEIALYLRRSGKFNEAQKLLLRTKREAQEIAQLPLNNPYPLIQINKKGDILFANSAALRTFPEIEPHGTAHPVLKGITEHKTREIFYQNKTYHQSVTATQIDDKETYIVYFYDITAQKEYERQLETACKETEEARICAEKAKEARGEFLANMSHELRTPMNGIIGLSGILADMQLQGEKRELVEAISSSASSLLILLNDILDFSKIEAGELTMESIPFDLRKTIRQIENLQKPVATQKNLILQSHIAENVPPYIIGDPARLQQILNNLVNNALKFTEKGSVTLSVDGKEDEQNRFITRITITDTGIGIPKNKQADVFAKFQQADTSTARKYGGTGLGLAITKNLTELMGATIELESQENVGSTFTITLPAQVASVQSGTPQRTASETPGGINTKTKLMIVDDHPINLLFMRKALKKLGFENFKEASSGRQALEIFQQNPCGMILMDCQMPEMDGFETAAAIRKTEPLQNRPVIIAVTANAMKEAEEQCIKAGMDDYISKPVDREKLKTLLQKWLPGDDNTIPEKTGKRQNYMNNEKENTKIFDWQRLHEFTEGDKDAENEIIRIFIENMQVDLNHLQKSFNDENYEEWDNWAHKLYGACSHIGARALAEICDKAQTLFPEKTDKIPEMHKAILTEYEHVHKALNAKKAA